MEINTGGMSLDEFLEAAFEVEAGLKDAVSEELPIVDLAKGTKELLNGVQDSSSKLL